MNTPSARPRYGELFAGIGGMSLGLERAGWEPAWFAENDAYCSRVLAKHWPAVPNLGDVAQVDWNEVERVELVCGGFPCQPQSYGGLRRGADDARWLWPEMERCVGILRPGYVLVENVTGLLTLGFDAVLGGLAALGFDAEWSVVPACALGAPHSRERVFVLAYSEGSHVESQMPSGALVGEGRPESRGGRGGARGSRWWLSEPGVDRMADGIPRRLVRAPLEATGNAVVPQVAEWIGAQLLASLAVQEGQQ